VCVADFDGRNCEAKVLFQQASSSILLQAINVHNSVCLFWAKNSGSEKLEHCSSFFWSALRGLMICQLNSSDYTKQSLWGITVRQDQRRMNILKTLRQQGKAITKFSR